MVNTTMSRNILRAIVSGALFAALASSLPVANAQTVASSGYALDASGSLPDEPGAVLRSSNISRSSDPNGIAGARADQAATAMASSPPEASLTQKYIEPGQVAPKQDAGDKVLLGLREAVSPFSAVGWLASAGYEQVLNGSPNYGTDRGAFGQRLGAAAIRDATEAVFSDCVMSPVFHEDPRYYRLGPSHNIFIRLIYSGTRPIIGRTDGGRTSPNVAQLAGTLAGAALASTYYPPLNRGFTQTMETFGGSLGGSAVGDVVSEFYRDFTQVFRSKRN
jgi:hypothetical protein